MSFKRVSAVMDIELSDGLAKWVLVTLAHHENSNTGHCFPSIDRLVKLTGLSRSTVIRCLKKLVDLRLIHKHPDRGKSNHYEFLFEYKVIRKNQCQSDTTPVSDRHPNREVIKKVVDTEQQKDVWKQWMPSDAEKEILNNEFGEIDHAKEIIKYKKYYATSTIAVPFKHYRSWCQRVAEFAGVNREGKEVLPSVQTGRRKSNRSRQRSSLVSVIRTIRND
jgi:DNA-binding transcriptional regulator GbsR (MarR family)